MVISNSSENPMRADVLLANANPQYSRASLAKLFDMNLVTKDDKLVKPGDKIKPGAFFDANVEPLEKPADDIELPIIYEDDNVLVINKPAGVISHARGRYWDEPSVASFIRNKTQGLDGERAGIVHRLDRATSGVMICAKNARALAYLQKQFSKRTVNKQYIALVRGRVEPKDGLIDIPIARNPSDPKTFRVDRLGKTAQTEYYTQKVTDNSTLLKLKPLTGRTHQLRIHLQYIKHPIIGDTVYGGEKADRLMLHAGYLEITIPGGVRKIFTAPLPPEFNK